MCQKEELMKLPEKFKEVKDLGKMSANAILIYLTDLGHYSNKAISAIVGTAPFCGESEKLKVKVKL